MQRLIFVLVLFLMCLVPVQAEGDFELKKPDAETFLRRISDLSIECNWYFPPDSYSTSAWNLCSYFIYYIEENYADELKDLPYDIIIDTYNILQPGYGNYGVGDAILWNEAIILTWLHDNEVNLDTESEFTAGQLFTKVKPQDFNADGNNEYILDVGIDSLEFSSLFVLARQKDGSYRRISGHLPYQTEAPYWSSASNQLREIAFDDFNADDLPEWLLASDGASYRGTYSGNIILLGWRDGELKRLDDHNIEYIPFFSTNADDLARDDIEDGYIFTNLDDDPALELQAIDITADNWRCKQSDSVVYDWSPEKDAYVKIRESVEQAATANCVITDAEDALFDHNYTTASYLYTYALTLPYETNNSEEDETFETEMIQYLQLRLAQSYLLSREYENANEILDSIDRQDLISQMTQDLYDILTEHRYAEPVETCTVIFNLFEEATYISYNYNSFQEYIGTSLTVGVSHKFAGDFIGAGNPVNPSFGGCNIPDQIDKILERSFYPSDANTLIEQLQNKGFLVHDYIHADFDGDDDEDWLIWHQANVQAILMTNGGANKTFDLSRLFFRKPSEHIIVNPIELPDSFGTAIVMFQAKEGLPSQANGYTCGDSIPVFGLLELWQYTENNLSSTINTTWCDDYTTIDSMFDEVDGKHIMYVRDPQNTGEVIVYTWDAESGRYMPPSEPEETASEPQSNFVAMAESTPSNEELHDLLGDGIRDYYLRLDEQVSNAGDIEAKIAILDTEINAPYMDYPYTLQYWKATILLNAGLEDEALAEFVAIYEAAPDSLWGKLAHLHFGEVEN